MTCNYRFDRETGSSMILVRKVPYGILARVLDVDDRWWLSTRCAMRLSTQVWTDAGKIGEVLDTAYDILRRGDEE